MATFIDWWPSPAKLNLFLHITGKNTNGYHLLQSLFQIVDLCDKIAFKVTDDNAILLTNSLEGVPSADNLIVKAAKLLQRYTGTTLGCQIRLEKILPMGGGIGGGSSNAATTLVALNYLWKTGLDENQLAELGLQLGADVPIFVRGNTAFAEGVGEHLTPVSLGKQIYVIAYPDCHVSTAEVFSAPDLPRNTAKIAWHEYTFASTHNDCQNLVCNRYPKVANLLHHLLEYAPSRMTGTGACVFAVFDDLDHAKKVCNTLPKDCQGFVATGVNRSPLHEYLANKIKTDINE